MTRLHAANRYDRLTHDLGAITGRPATSVRDFVAPHIEPKYGDGIEWKLKQDVDFLRDA